MAADLRKELLAAQPHEDKAEELRPVRLARSAEHERLLGVIFVSVRVLCLVEAPLNTRVQTQLTQLTQLKNIHTHTQTRNTHTLTSMFFSTKCVGVSVEASFLEGMLRSSSAASLSDLPALMSCVCMWAGAWLECG